MAENKKNVKKTDAKKDTKNYLNPILSWGVSGGTLLLAIVIGLIVCL